VEAGLVLYEAKIGFDVPPDSELKVGMSATADIIIHHRSNVLLVPERAVTQDIQGNPIVRVMVNEQIQEKSVVIGINDGYHTEIVSGLQEGDVVVVETTAKSTEPGGFFF
jgi:multidrug efflux pump subunit AcrA (membrane-fusion protein)